MYKINYKDLDLINIGLVLNGEKNLNHLLDLILQLGMNLTSSDSGCIFLMDNSMLHYTMIYIKSKKLNLSNLETSQIPMLPIQLTDNNIYTYSIQNMQIINIKDVYSNSEYDLDNTKILDKKIGYHTQSTIIIPLFTNANEVLGLLQFSNCRNSKNKIIAYPQEADFVLFYFAAQTAMAIDNLNDMQETKELLYDFAEVIAAAIDERAPYNADHSRNVANYIKKFVNYYNEQYKQGYVDEYFDESRSEQLYLAALLHDIGKIAIPLDIMNKPTRLASLLEPLLSRFELFRSYFEIDLLKHFITKEEYDSKLEELNEIQNFVMEVNSATFLDSSKIEKAKHYSTYIYKRADGTNLPYFTPLEIECLTIQKGTLTTAERSIMQSHVIITSKMLSRFNFKSHYANIPRWANSHHEFLDGSGYPNHLTAKDMPIEIRILCIVDIYDALTATDRPYKRPISKDKALEILHSMAYEGKLDLSLVLHFSDMLQADNER